jgi:hypothetical protein
MRQASRQSRHDQLGRSSEEWGTHRRTKSKAETYGWSHDFAMARILISSALEADERKAVHLSKSFARLIEVAIGNIVGANKARRDVTHSYPAII